MKDRKFKKITVVPSADEFVNIVLSRTQRQTPTVVHKGYDISRLREFYIRKVKFTEQNFVGKLSAIIEEFPRLDRIHPFYGDLFHSLYDKDHYKLALGHVHKAEVIIKKISSDYVRLLKYGDSLYRCKRLKIAALGRMRTVIKGAGASLAYLEQVRQHMARLPSIDPSARTVLICGCPNVGKSSFINKITNANVDVQPYAFTTKSLFVGHTNYNTLKYQVIDTPGLLDRPLQDRNIIEMCTITALANLEAVVLFFLDISGSCGYSVAQQAALFHSIKPLFANKPLLIVCNKIDLQPLDSLSEDDMKLVMEMQAEASTNNLVENDGGVLLHTMSALNDEGVFAVKATACEMLLTKRVEAKMKSNSMQGCLNRLCIATPKPRDSKERPPCIPEGVLKVRAGGTKRKLEKELENENGGAGVYSADLRKHFILIDDLWKGDIMPEILDGHNVYDFVDPCVLSRLEELKREEQRRLQVEGEEPEFECDGLELGPEDKEVLSEIRKRKSLLRQEHRIKKSTAESRPIVPRKFDKDRKFTADRMRRQLSSVGLDPSAAIDRACKRGRSISVDQDVGDVMDVDDGGPHRKKLRMRSRCASSVKPRSASLSLGKVVPGEGFRDSAQKMRAIKIARKSTRMRNKAARRGEGDRVIPNLRPKHLFSGKRSIGKNSRR